MKLNIRIISLFLLLVMVSQCFVACKGTDLPKNDETDDTQNTPSDKNDDKEDDNPSSDSASVSKIDFLSLPKKTEYYVNETLDTAGLILKASYTDGTSQVITSGYSCSPTVLETVGTQTITVSYEGQTATFDVSVSEASVTEISVVNMPEKITYYLGEDLNTAGIALKVTYASGNAEIVTSGFTCSLTNFTTAGVCTVTITYGGVSATFMVTVLENKVSEIKITKAPNKVSYYKNDILDTTGMEVQVTYENGNTETVTDGFTCTPTVLNTAGSQTITVTYGGKSDTYSVTVSNDSVSKIEITKKPTKLTYYKGEALNTAGLELKATYASGNTETITSGFTCSPTTLNTVGTQTITVTYGGKTATFTVTVTNDSVSKIEVTTKPTKTSYYKGETLNTAGMQVKVTYASGKTETITSGFTCSPTTLNTVGTQTITVTYSGKTTTFTVSVSSDTVSKIEVTTKPTKTSYYKGDTLNTAGMQVKVTYASGKTETITSGFTCSPTTLNTVGTQTITVTYGGKTATFTVTVSSDTVSKIEVTTKPTKTSYYKGDTLNTAGMQVKATYASGKTETITTGFTCSPTTLNTVGTQTITVTYSGKTTTFTVTVKSTSSGLKYTEDGNSYYVAGIGSCTDTAIVIPSTYNGKPVTGIGAFAFEDCTSLTSVSIPDSVTTIGIYAFSGCTSLASINIPSSFTTIGSGAFSGCTSLTSISIPSSVTEIGANAFYNTGYYNNSANWTNNVLYIGKYLIKAKNTISGSYTIKSGTLVIANNAFYNCTSLTSVSIPNSVIEIGSDAFSSCPSLSSITVASGNTVYYSQGNCIIEKSGKTLVVGCKTSVIPNDVTKIGSGAFYECFSLTSISVPSSVTAIGVLAFGYCTSLTSVSIPNSVTYIGSDAFSYCTSLTSISIPNSVITIDHYAFYECSSLKTIYCEAPSKPSGWDSNWLRGCSATVHWNSTWLTNDPDSIAVYEAKDTLTKFNYMGWYNVNIASVPAYNPENLTDTTAGPVEIWADHLHMLIKLDSSECDATAGIDDPETYEYRFMLYYRPYDVYNNRGDYDVAELDCWSIFPNAFNDNISIYRCLFYDTLYEGMEVDVEYEVVLVVYKGDEALGYAESSFVWTDSCEAFVRVAENDPNIIK